MKNLLLLLLFLCRCIAAGAQTGNGSDGSTPIIWPQRPDTTNKECKDSLIYFSVSCCTEKRVAVKDISTVQFSGDGNCKPQVTFNPAEIVPRSTQLKPILKVPVSATANGITLWDTIMVVNRERKTVSKPALPKELDKLADLANYVNKTFTDKITPALKKVDNVLKSKLSWLPCKPTQFTIRPGVSVEYFWMCCGNGDTICPVLGIKVQGELRAGIGIKCTGPFPYANIAGYGLTIVLSAGVSLAGQASGQSSCKGIKVCAGFEGKGTIGGGVGADVKVITVDGQLVLDGFGVKGELCFYPEFGGCLKVVLGKLKVVVTYEDYWGIISGSVEYVLFEGFEIPVIGCNG